MSEWIYNSGGHNYFRPKISSMDAFNTQLLHLNNISVNSLFQVDMADPRGCPPGNSWWSTHEELPRPMQAYGFQALRDWTWFQSAPTSPWGPNSTCSVSSYGSPGYSHSTSGYYNHQNQYERQERGKKQWRNRKEPEFVHFCDTCDRGFKNQDKYNQHISQHVKCSFADCKYTAHEKLVSIHWKNSHTPGAMQIKLDTPEEIERWRQERKRNYPTLSNVEKKIKLSMVKEKRGDVLKTSHFGCFKTHGQVHGGCLHEECFQTQTQHAYDGHKHLHPGREKVAQASHFTCSPHNVDPLGALATSDPDSEKEESVKENVAISVAPKNVTFALGSLMSSYGEDMTESDEETEEKTLFAAHCNPDQNSEPKPDIRPINEKSVCAQESYPQPEFHLLKKGQISGGRQRERQHTKLQKCSTLLEMLLAPDICHERNVVLQCICYIIYKKFF